MWITPDGERHTAELVDPTIAMSGSFVDSLDGLDEQERVMLLDTIEGESENLFELELTVMGVEGQELPEGYLDGHFDSSTEIMSYLKSREIEWRLDGYEAVSDYLWIEDEPQTFMDNLRDLFRSLWT